MVTILKVSWNKSYLSFIPFRGYQFSWKRLFKNPNLLVTFSLLKEKVTNPESYRDKDNQPEAGEDNNLY